MIPFDAKKLNRPMEEAGLQLVLACARHNVRYLTGGYYYHFLTRMPRFGRTLGKRSTLAQRRQVARPSSW